MTGRDIELAGDLTRVFYPNVANTHGEDDFLAQTGIAIFVSFLAGHSKQPGRYCVRAISAMSRPLQIIHMRIAAFTVKVINHGQAVRVWKPCICYQPVHQLWLLFSAAVGKPHPQVACTFSDGRLERVPTSDTSSAFSPNLHDFWKAVNNTFRAYGIPPFVPHNITHLRHGITSFCRTYNRVWDHIGRKYVLA